MNQDTPHDTPPQPGDEQEDFAGEFDLTPDGDEPTFEDVINAEGPADGEAAADDEPVTAEELAALRQRGAKAEAQRDEMEAKLMRTAADYQNFVRRSQLNLEAEKQETLMKVVKSLVGVLDNFDRALEVDPETTPAADVQQGVESIHASLIQALEGFGLKKITVQPGDEFDPNLHEALMRQPVKDLESNHVAAQFMPGYTLNGQPLRPAQVSVAE